MTTITQAIHGRHRDATAGVFNLGQRLWRWIEWLEHAAERQRQRRSLAALDDRLLADIGLSRADALHQASKPFWIE
jgi:uncharacterized protein YjiS (DUF1127 family)